MDVSCGYDNHRPAGPPNEDVLPERYVRWSLFYAVYLTAAHGTQADCVYPLRYGSIYQKSIGVAAVHGFFRSQRT